MTAGVIAVKQPGVATKRAWWHRMLLMALFVGTLAAAALFGASSVRTWMDQNAQRVEAERTAVEFDSRVADLKDEIARRTSAGGVQREALCFGPYVEPGTEVYAVMGLNGCVGQSLGP